MSAQRLAASLAFVLALAAPARAEPVALDDLLRSLAGSCVPDDAWIKMKRYLVNAERTRTGPVVVPDEFGPALGEPGIVSRNPEEGTITVEVPVRNATFRGLPVAKLRIAFARDYPLMDDSVIFATAGDTVLAAFADDLAAFARDNPDGIVEYMLHDDPDGPRLSCFATN